MKYDPKRLLKIVSHDLPTRLVYADKTDGVNPQDYVLIIHSKEEFFESLVAFHNKMIGLKELSCPSTPSTPESGAQTKSEEVQELSRALNGLTDQMALLMQRSSEQERVLKQALRYISIFSEGMELVTTKMLQNWSSLLREVQENEESTERK